MVGASGSSFSKSFNLVFLLESVYFGFSFTAFFLLIFKD